jgi:hypothetical protein
VAGGRVRGEGQGACEAVQKRCSNVRGSAGSDVCCCLPVQPTSQHTTSSGRAQARQQPPLRPSQPPTSDRGLALGAAGVAGVERESSRPDELGGVAGGASWPPVGSAASCSAEQLAVQPRGSGLLPLSLPPAAAQTAQGSCQLAGAPSAVRRLRQLGSSLLLAGEPRFEGGRLKSELKRLSAPAPAGSNGSPPPLPLLPRCSTGLERERGSWGWGGPVPSKACSSSSCGATAAPSAKLLARSATSCCSSSLCACCRRAVLLVRTALPAFRQGRGRRWAS